MTKDCCSIKLNGKCNICSKKYNRLFSKTYLTTCGHRFHLKCIRNWLYYEKRGTCPLCNHKEQWINPDPFLRISGY